MPTVLVRRFASQATPCFDSFGRLQDCNKCLANTSLDEGGTNLVFTTNTN